jgi:hypothetical protein
VPNANVPHKEFTFKDYVLKNVPLVGLTAVEIVLDVTPFAGICL